MSTAAAIPIEAPLAPGPRRHPITVDEYFRLGETGVLDPQARVELIEGEIIDRPPIGAPHASKTNRLIDLLTAAVRGRAIVSAATLRQRPTTPAIPLSSLPSLPHRWTPTPRTTVR